MPRDANGSYTLPSGNPVTSGTTIEATWANTTLDDIRQAMTDSLDRYGRGGMQVPFRFTDGTLAAPGISWSGEISTGFFRAGAADMQVSVGGVAVMRFTTAGAHIWDGTGWVLLTSGGYLPLTGGTLTGDLTIASASTPEVLFNQTGAAANNRLWSMVNTGTAFGLEARGDASGARQGMAFTRSGVAITQIELGNTTDQAPVILRGEARLPSPAGTEDVRIGCTSTVGSVTVTTGKELALKVGTQSRLRLTAAGQVLVGGATQNGGAWYHADAALMGSKVTLSTSAAPATGTPGDIWLQVA